LSTSPSSPPRFRVGVLADPDSEDASLSICNALRRSGADVHVGRPERSDAAIVIVLSAGLLASGTTLPEPSQFPDCRLVPVSFGDVDQARIPTGLAELNWILWHTDRASLALDSVLTACMTDLESYRTGQAVLARAEGWEIAGRRSVDLIGNRKQLAATETALARSGISTSALLVNYLQASVRETRRLRLRAIRRLAFRVALAVALIAGGLVVAKQIGYMRERSTLEAVASLDDVDLYPQANAIKLAALVLVQSEAGDRPSSATIDRLTGMLSEPWPRSSIYTSPDDKGTNDAVPQDDGGIFTIDGGGTIWHAAIGAAIPTRVIRAMEGPGYFLAIDAAANVFAAADKSKLVMLRSSTRSETAIPDTITGLRLGAQGDQLAVSVADGVRLIDLNTSPLNAGKLYTNVLASAFVGGRLIGLQRTGKQLDLFDLATGNTLRTYPDPTGPLSVAAIGPSGDVAVQAADGSLLAAKPGADLTSTGLWVPDLLNSIEITGAGQLLYTPKGWTTQVFDLRRGIPLANVCRESSALSLRLSPDGIWAVCSYGAQKYVWNLDDIRPVTSGGEPVPQTRVAVGTLSARILSSGPLEVSVDDTTRTWDLTGSQVRAGASSDPLPTGLQLAGQLTTLAITADGGSLAVGSSAGEMVLADLNGGELRAATTWSSPDGSPVQAITLTETEATITTSTATWRIPTCAGCTRNLGKLVLAVHNRQLPCYPADFSQSVPARLLTELDVQLCQA
jgi:hypothetical protein